MKVEGEFHTPKKEEFVAAERPQQTRPVDSIPKPSGKWLCFGSINNNLAVPTDSKSISAVRWADNVNNYAADAALKLISHDVVYYSVLYWRRRRCETRSNQ